jgi:sulfite exporter TauE/SafE
LLQRRLFLLAQLISSLGEIKTYFPWVSFLAGLGGSLHCVGMCGGLVTASCDRSKDIFRYQLGRLVGYLGLGALAGFLGRFLTIGTLHPFYSLLPALFIGSLFIFWGIKNYQGKRAELPAASFLGKIYSKFWAALVKDNKNFSKSFIIGLISILLPCGLLYGVVLGTVAMEHSYTAMFSMIFFWLGTLPSMILAPEIIQRFIRPFKSKLPKTFAISLVLIGVMTISLRMFKLYEIKNLSPTQHKMTCH